MTMRLVALPAAPGLGSTPTPSPPADSREARTFGPGGGAVALRDAAASVAGEAGPSP